VDNEADEVIEDDYVEFDPISQNAPVSDLREKPMEALVFE